MRIKQLRTYHVFKPLIGCRDFIWYKFGLFEVKKTIKQKLYFKRVAKEDAKRRKNIAEQIMLLPKNLLPNEPILKSENINIIVSMTSYGKRVESTCPYALYTILTQNKLPNRIVLNLDKKSWNDNSIPLLLRKLQDVGVEINYVEDIGPHTKLLPTLKKYPNDIIITADDDILYDNKLVSELIGAYETSEKKSVICREGTRAIDENGNYLVYSKQFGLEKQCHEANLIPMGFAGVLYPPHIFLDEIFNVEVIRKLCPKADDIWFGIMEILSKIKILYIAPNSFSEVDVDVNEEYNPQVSGALHFINGAQGQNDIQWNAVVEYYHLNETSKRYENNK